MNGDDANNRRTTMTTITLTESQATRYDVDNDADGIMNELRAILDAYEARGEAAEIVHPDGFVVVATR